MTDNPEQYRQWTALGIDITVPHSARMYDWWLGGKDNFEPDRALGEAFMAAIPNIRAMARENRRFLGRAVRHLVAEAGIRQFLDIGTGIPTEGNVHEVAQALAPECNVVYVDNDPIVLAHARALLVSQRPGSTAYIHADLRDPHAILADPALTKTLDLGKPVALMMVAVLMLLDDDEDPWGKARVLMDALPSGSYLALTHPGQDFDPEAMAAIKELAGRAGLTVVPRVKADVARFFADWELIDPGVVPVNDWRPGSETVMLSDEGPAYYWAGIARKP
ncbi:SAM-dependent methyltransferase [Thermoactinospora rubra]|uniref:SAM-dependent methyltransferase n=1 Tax=Thermoactinospora rubra TaxID=1088767 RepID=UPI000A113BCB|nr:SAM-dependent methyltransferase [Thermoactinospora rubra]